ncbi:transcriptional regulator [Nocardioides flavus (ex Wang et al. 2016)]|uniref:Transcriptional regulator n=1 Tax=Nocardioides flavus (ex Wang et al. 2016) TaxID=2058780 RepID=A0ABQ3HK13_9ACTN|nr:MULTISPECIES: helix-turn-helix transcriptional regulator [Nocardioides]GHE18028.1 transcriptional regulator [Nocardioides flavus (ex Wang et al. 2016)]
MADRWTPQLEALGHYIKTQRQLADLSLRQMAELAEVSNPYLSQIERGMHQPSVRVLRSIARALNISAESLLTQAGLLDAVASEDGGAASGVEAAIKADPRLSQQAKQTLLAVYRTLLPDDGDAGGTEGSST